MSGALETIHDRLHGSLDDPSRRRVLLALVLLLALGIRLYVAWQWDLWSAPGPDRLRGDEISYDGLAREIIAGQPFSWPGRVPLYPAFLAAVLGASAFSYLAVACVQALLGTLTVALMYVLGSHVAGPRVGLLAALFGSVSYVLVRDSTELLSEVLFTPAVLAMTIALNSAWQTRSVRAFAVTGALIGLCNMIRPTLVLFPIAVALVLVLRRRPRAVAQSVALLATAAIVVAPWMVHVAVRYRTLLPLATSNAILWQGSPEYYHFVRDSGYTYLDVWRNVLYDDFDDAPDPGTIEGETYWRRRALASISSEPSTYLRYSVEKVATYWIGDPNADWNDTFIFNYRALRAWGFDHASAAQLWLARALPLLFPLLVLALWGQRGRYAAIYLVLAYCTLLHAVTHAEARLSEPLQPYLLLMLAAVVAGIHDRIGAARWPPPAPA